MSCLVNPYVYGAGGWVPTNDGNLWIWYNGATNSGANGSSVTTWADSSGHSNNATSGTGVTLDTTGLNGFNVVDSSSSANMAIPNVLTGLTAASIYAVVKNDAANSGGWTRTGSADFTGGGNHYPYVDTVVYDHFGSTVRKTTGTPSIALTNWHIVSMHSSSGLYELYLNGIQHYTTATNTVGWTAVPNLFQGQSTTHYIGKTAMIFIVTAHDGTSPRQIKEGYLAHHFGITSVLDAGHPYKTTPP